MEKEQESQTNYYELPYQDVIEQLKTEARKGLSETEVNQRYEQYGANELEAKPGKPWWLRFILQFNDPLLYILLIAGAVKAFMGSWTNAIVIWGVTLLNAVIGYVQEAKAESAIAALAKSVSTEATVLRDGRPVRIPSRELVPGDIVTIASGDKVPADIRLFKVTNLQVDESALTGESVPVQKSVAPLPSDTALADRTNMSHAGSFVTSGQASGVVVATANATEVGKISKSMEESVTLTTPLTRKFAKFSKILLYVILAIATFTLVVGVAQGQDVPTMFDAAVALAVSAIPEGLPAVVTITLAIGVNRMAARNAIIRKLPAVESLGSATVICSDKTGTLTENKMTVQRIDIANEHYVVSGSGYSPNGEIALAQQNDSEEVSITNGLNPALKECLMAGILCNDSWLEEKGGDWTVVGDPTEGALITVASKVGLNQSELTQERPRLDAIPFESQYQYMATLHDGESPVIYVKGSVEAILKRCSQETTLHGKQIPLQREGIEHSVHEMADQGLRVLAFAKKEVDSSQKTVDHDDIQGELVFLGLQGMIDPPREEATKAVAACQSAGIQVKMITGDHVATARAIAQKMGIQKEGQVFALTGQQLEHMDKAKIVHNVEKGSVFARVAPAQKLQLVEGLQSRGEIVAMTGDGVNDAPALKQADIGIAMGQGGTEVARDASDMLLTDDNFASIEAAVEEGRNVYQNIRKAIAFLLPVNGGESMTILISALLVRDLPILAIQVLWLNMINSVTMTVPLAFEPKTEGLMKQPPRDPNEPLITRKLLQRIGVVSLFNWILIFGVFEWAEAVTGNVEIARTMAIQSLVAARIIYLLSISQLGASLVQFIRGNITGLANTSAIAVGIFGAIALQILFSQLGVMNTLFETASLNWQQWLLCLLPMLPMIPTAMLANYLDP